MFSEHGTDPTDTTAAINLLTELNIASIQETDEEIVVIFNPSKTLESCAIQTDEALADADLKILYNFLMKIICSYKV